LKACAANPAHVVDELRDALVEVESDRVAIADSSAAKLRLSADGDRGTVDRNARRAELMPPRVLDAKLIQRRSANRGDDLTGWESIRSVKSVARSVVVRPPAMFEGECS
jgi:hypothetical protein